MPADPGPERRVLRSGRRLRWAAPRVRQPPACRRRRRARGAGPGARAAARASASSSAPTSTASPSTTSGSHRCGRSCPAAGRRCSAIPTVACCTDGLREYAMALAMGFMADTMFAVGRLAYCRDVRPVSRASGGSSRISVGPSRSSFLATTTTYRQFPECRENIERPPSEIMRELYYDTCTMHAPALRCALETFGAEQLVFGSDYPHVPGGIDRFVTVLNSVGLSDEQLRDDRARERRRADRSRGRSDCRGGDAMRTIISGGRVVTSALTIETDVLIEDETIEAVGLVPGRRRGRSVIDATGKLVLPGGVDPAHPPRRPRLKGTITADDFYSGTVAAAIGRHHVDHRLPGPGEGAGPARVPPGLVRPRRGEGRRRLGPAPDHHRPSRRVLPGDRRAGPRGLAELQDVHGVSGRPHGRRRRHLQGHAAERGERRRSCSCTARTAGSSTLLEKEALAAGNVDPPYNAVTRPPVTESEATARADRPRRAGRGARLRRPPLGGAGAGGGRRRPGPGAARLRGDLPALPAAHRGEAVRARLRRLEVRDVPAAADADAHQERLWKGLRTNELQVVSTDHTPVPVQGPEGDGPGATSRRSPTASRGSSGERS